MKTFTIYLENKEKKIIIQANSLNYLSTDKLEKYIKVTNKFISDDTKQIIKYLIDNNSTYISNLSTDTDENALAGFYNSEKPTDETLIELYNHIDNVNKVGRLLEIPVFQTKEQFNKIIKQEVSPDYIFYNLETVKGQNNAAKQFQPLVHKICRQYFGKSNFDYNDLLSSANVGLTHAIKTFGKTKTNENLEKNISEYTFLQYAAHMIRFAILDGINHESRTVRIPKSQINKIRKNNGEIAKSNTLSGDQLVNNHTSKDDGNKTIFDFIDSQESSDNALNRHDLDKLWKEIYKEIIKKYGEKIFNVWCSFYGLNDFEKLKNKEIAKQYNVSNSLITYYCTKVNQFIQNDKKIFSMLKDVYELLKECLNEEDRKIDLSESRSLKI